jgi:hypothetical protein
MYLLARDAGDRFIARFIGWHFLCGPALHVLARIRAAIEKRRNRGTPTDLSLSAFTRASERQTFVP